MRVLDLCAGAGGKTLLLAAELRGEGELHAFDTDMSKLARLQQRADRAGVRGLVVHSQLPPPLECDAVLVDAPCSELGALRRGPDARFRVSADLSIVKLQLGLLQQGASHVRAGGRLIYATCTLRREENEGVVEAFLREAAAFRVVRAGGDWLDGGLRRGDFFLSVPHRHGTDGFFAAVLERSAT
jgi:16S rRNA (cytosine967-C5)-methyltransferase